jgi:hypothetical protein
MTAIHWFQFAVAVFLALGTLWVVGMLIEHILFDV